MRFILQIILVLAEFFDSLKLAAAVGVDTFLALVEVQSGGLVVGKGTL